MPKIMTEEYCRTCPFFNEHLDFLEQDDPYWGEHPELKCVCKDCPRREACEAGANKDFLLCMALLIERKGVDCVLKEYYHGNDEGQEDNRKALKQLKEIIENAERR
ncbi:hypothetical protein ES703_87186 [subsurface metagenome]